MAEKKRQHTIPNSYLKAWCDPQTPAEHTPYIWRIKRDGSEKKKKSPEKSFTSTDRYTIKLPGGERDLVVENTLGDIENDFVNVLSRIRNRENLDLPDRVRLCLFLAAMHGRTIAMGEHWRDQYKNLHDIVVALERAHGAEPSTSLETADLVDKAAQHTVMNSIKIETPLLMQMQMSVAITDSELGFITSDTPCIWFNPTSHRLPPMYQAPGLGQPHIEVSLPLSPNHLLFVSHCPRLFYVDVDESLVDEANRMSRFHCSEEFVSWKGETRPYWFERGQEPEDTWEKSEAREKLLEERDAILKDLREGPHGVARPAIDDSNDKNED